MDTLEQLQRDHELLRSKLNVLESANRVGAEAWFVLRQVCFSLLKQLQDHMRSEEEFVLACYEARLDGDDQATLLGRCGHQEDRRRLQVIHWLLQREPTVVLSSVRFSLDLVIASLRRSIDEQESELFPRLGRAGASPAVPIRSPHLSAGHLKNTMTLSEVVRRYPKTKHVFERVLISLPFEQYDCLDEVAWRHGLDSRELLTRLERAIAQGEARR